eukprot:scaffold128598_cov26-Prasinocladus_malaysianus.AAC.1
MSRPGAAGAGQDSVNNGRLTSARQEDDGISATRPSREPADLFSFHQMRHCASTGREVSRIIVERPVSAAREQQHSMRIIPSQRGDRIYLQSAVAEAGKKMLHLIGMMRILCQGLSLSSKYGSSYLHKARNSSKCTNTTTVDQAIIITVASDRRAGRGSDTSTSTDGTRYGTRYRTTRSGADAGADEQ